MTREKVCQECLNAAYRYLSYRPRSEMEIKLRLLKRGFDDSNIEGVMQRLREKALVDDNSFARFWRHNRETFSPRSRTMLQRELREKGVACHVIEDALDGFNDESNAYIAAQKKMGALSSLDYKDFYYKLGAFLRRRGFGYTITKNTVNQVWQEMGG